MKKALIFFNLILAVAVIFIALSNLSSNNKKAPAKSSTKSSTKASAGSENRGNQKDSGAVKLLPADAAVAKIVEKDVFNQIRSPLAYTRVGRSEMTLVGVIDGKAAIIKSNNRQRQFNPFLAQAMRMSAGMTGSGRFTQWSRMSGNRNNAPVQQYVRIGETMSSGYVLTEVSRSRAVLVRGNDKLELELQDPSRNRAQARQRTQRLNSTQQFQQAQMFMQSQMIRTMREIQQNSRNNNAPAGNRNRR